MATTLEPAASSSAAVGSNAPDDIDPHSPPAAASMLREEQEGSPVVRVSASELRSSGATSPRGQGHGGHTSPAGFISDEEERLYELHAQEPDVKLDYGRCARAQAAAAAHPAIAAAAPPTSNPLLPLRPCLPFPPCRCTRAPEVKLWMPVFHSEAERSAAAGMERENGGPRAQHEL